MRDLSLGIVGALVGHFFLLSMPLAGFQGQGDLPAPQEPGRVTIRFAKQPQPVTAAPAPPAPKQVRRQPEPPPQEKPAHKPSPPVKKEVPVATKERVVEQQTVVKTVQAVPEQVVAMARPTDPALDHEQAVNQGMPGDQSGKVALSLAVYRAAPRYPALARKRGWQGTVLLELVIEKDGSVSLLEIHSASGHRILDKAALEAVRKWRFQPLIKNGKSLASRQFLPISFKLED